MTSLKNPSVLGTSTLAFYLAIWFVNPSNKLMVILSIVFLFLLAYIINHVQLAALFTYLITTVLPMGKKYVFVLHDLKEFPLLKELYPIGLTESISLSVADVIFSIFLLSIFINLTTSKFRQLRKIKISLLDILIVLFFFYGMFADLYASSRPFLSLFFKKGLSEMVVIYFSLKYYFQRVANLTYSVMIIFVSILFFESFLALQQFIFSAPLGKNFEAMFNIEQFGAAPDELIFSFRPLGTLSHANDLGLFIASLMPILFYLLLNKNSPSIIPISFFTGLIVLFLTLSRSAWLGFFVSIGFFIYILEHRFKINLIEKFSLKKIAYVSLLFLPLIIYLMPRVARTVYSTNQSGGLTLRIRQISESLELLASQPLTGVGAGMSVFEMIERNKNSVFVGFPSSVHNYYVLLAVENGLPSLILLLIIVILSIKKFLASHRPHSFAWISAYLVILIGALFQPFFNFQLFFILLGLNSAKISSDVQTN